MASMPDHLTNPPLAHEVTDQVNAWLGAACWTRHHQLACLAAMAAGLLLRLGTPPAVYALAQVRAEVGR